MTGAPVSRRPRKRPRPFRGTLEKPRRCRASGPNACRAFAPRRYQARHCHPHLLLRRALRLGPSGLTHLNPRRRRQSLTFQAVAVAEPSTSTTPHLFSSPQAEPISRIRRDSTSSSGGGGGGGGGGTLPIALAACRCSRQMSDPCGQQARSHRARGASRTAPQPVPSRPPALLKTRVASAGVIRTALHALLQGWPRVYNGGLWKKRRTEDPRTLRSTHRPELTNNSSMNCLRTHECRLSVRGWPDKRR
jgi:hypothetical protein